MSRYQLLCLATVCAVVVGDVIEAQDTGSPKSTLDGYFERYCDYTGGLGINHVASHFCDYEFRQRLKETNDAELKRLFVLQHLYREVDAGMVQYERGEISVGKGLSREMTSVEKDAARRRLLGKLKDLEQLDPGDPRREIADHRRGLK